METTVEDNDLSPFERQLLLRIRENSARTWTPECLEPEMVLDLIQQEEDSAVTAQQMAHIASCAICRQSYVSMLETWHLAQEVRSLEMAATATAPISLSASTNTAATPRKLSVRALFSKLFASKPPAKSGNLLNSPVWTVRRNALVTGFALLLLALPLVSAWLVKQNADLRTQLVAKQTVPPHPIDMETKPLLAYSLPSAREQSLLNESTRTVPVGNSGDDMPPLTLTSPRAKALLPEDAPLFGWQPVKGADSYMVTIFNSSNPQNKIKPSPHVTTTQWKASQSFPRGNVFEWGVTAYDKTGNVVTRSNTARFLVLKAE